ncbi:hypothetical protein B7463_g7310, partial [Scytalidium lignicola]
MRLHPFLALLPLSLAANVESKPIHKPMTSKTSLALMMLDSIIDRKQGISVNTSVKTSVIEGGLLLVGISATLEHMDLNYSQKSKYRDYLELITSGLSLSLENVTTDTVSPLDEFSVGTQFIYQYLETGNRTLLRAIQGLHEADLLRERQEDGSYWYFTYPNATTQDGLFSIPSFHALYAREFDSHNALTAYKTAALQFSNIVDHCVSHSTEGLLYHGYDPTGSFPVWGNLTSRGHSQSIWGRAVGWTCTGLLLTLDVIPEEPATLEVREELIGIFVKLMNAILMAQDLSGGWWQMMNFPGRHGNYLESSSTGLFSQAMLRGIRFGYLGTTTSKILHGDQFSAEEYIWSAERGWYNLTVDICSINSHTSFEYYVAQPLKPQSLLGEVGFILTDIEMHIAKE